MTVVFRSIVSTLLLCALLANAGETAAELKQSGIAALKESQNQPELIVTAARCFAKASALYEAEGKSEIAVEMNSFLYWCKKKMTLKDIEAFTNGGETVVAEKIKSVDEKPAPVSEAQAWLTRAENFARGHADDPLLVAIRFFEVGDRFKESEVGRKAIDLSLKAMQRVGEKAKLESYKPAPTDGKAFIKSEPPGAAIILVTPDGGHLDTDKKTPALLQLPVGQQTLKLRLKGFSENSVQVTINGAAIARPEAVMLDPLTISIDIFFDEGWRVYVDSREAKIQNGKNDTPCTAELPLGAHDLGLAKTGYADIHQRIEVTETGIKLAKGFGKGIEIKAQSVKGVSKLLLSSLLMRVDTDRDRIRGWWSLKNGTLVTENPDAVGTLQLPYRPAEEYDFTTEFSINKGLMCWIIVAGRYQFELQLGHNNNKDFIGFEMVGDKSAGKNESTKPFTLVPNQRYNATIKVRKDGVSAYVDDKLATELKTDYSNLVMHPYWMLRDPRALGIGTYRGNATFYSITVKDVTGVGELIGEKK